MGVVDDEGNSTGVKRSVDYIEQNYDRINQCYQRYLLEAEGDELKDDLEDPQGSFEKYRKSALSEFGKFKKDISGDFKNFQNEISSVNTTKMPETGGTWAELKEDGTTVVHQEGKPDTVVNSKNQSIPNIEKQGKQINKNGVSGTYILKEKDGGYSLSHKMTVSLYKNPNAKVFQNGSNGFDDSGITVKNNMYHFRGLVAGTHSALKMSINGTAQNIAVYTEIYNDILSKGNNISNAEKKFMSDFEQLLKNHGLKINKEGFLEESN